VATAQANRWWKRRGSRRDAATAGAISGGHSRMHGASACTVASDELFDHQTVAPIRYTMSTSEPETRSEPQVS
jgi:hypothetical protein